MDPQPLPIKISKDSKNLLFMYGNLVASALQKTTIDFQWVVPEVSDNTDCENFLGANSVLLEVVPSQKNLNFLPSLMKKSLFTFTTGDSQNYKIYSLQRVQATSDYFHYHQNCQLLKTKYNCTAVHYFWHFSGLERIITPIVLEDSD